MNIGVPVATTTRPITFAEFEQLPEPRDGYRLELRHGQPIKVPPAKYIHFMIQQILRDLLDKAAAGAGRAYTEVGFRPTPEHEFRIADVAYAATDRWVLPAGQECLLGAPDIVVEVCPLQTPQPRCSKKNSSASQAVAVNFGLWIPISAS
jgi:Uma2 family endonuclease